MLDPLRCAARIEAFGSGCESVDRLQFQQLAELRLEDAEALLASGRWAAAYYLLGYSVDCALKACIARQFREHDVPERKLVNSFYAHDLYELLVISGLQPEFRRRATQDPVFDSNWEDVSEWTESVRYDVLIEEEQARRMHDALINKNAGILTWLRTQF